MLNVLRYHRGNAEDSSRSHTEFFRGTTYNMRQKDDDYQVNEKTLRHSVIP